MPLTAKEQEEFYRLSNDPDIQAINTKPKLTAQEQEEFNSLSNDPDVQGTRSFYETVMPRVSGNKKASTGRNVANTLLDLASLPFRAGVGAIETGAEAAGWSHGGGKLSDFPLRESITQNIANTGSDNLGESLLRSPANIIPGIGTAGSIGKIMSKAPTLSKVIQGLVQGGASAGIHQAENYGSGNPVSGTQAALETGIGGAIPGAAALAKGSLGRLSEKIMNVAVKPKPSFSNKNAIDFQKMFSAGIRPGVIGTGKPLENLEQGLQQKFNDLEQKLKTVINTAGDQGENINLYQTVLEDLPKQLKDNKKLLPIRDEINRQYDKMLDNIGNDAYYGKELLTPSEALELKRIVGKEGAWVSAYDKSGNLNTNVDPEAAAREIVYNELYKSINQKLKTVTGKEFQEINKEFSELIPIEKSIRYRLNQSKNNEIFSLSDLMYAGLGGGLGFGNPVTSFSDISQGDLTPLYRAAGGVALSKGLRSPRTASLMNRASNIKPNPRMQALARQGIQNMLFNPGPK